MGREDLVDGSPYFQALVHDIAEHDSDSLPDLMRLWDTVPAIETQPARIVYRVVWRHGDGTALRFNCLLAEWSEFDAVAIRDWHPADAVTWTWLSSLH